MRLFKPRWPFTPIHQSSLPVNRSHLLNPLGTLLLVAAMAFVVVRGVIPGLMDLYTDFPNYYVAGKVVFEGQDVGRLYDDVWFHEQMRQTGITVAGKFSPFPPPTALLLVPFAYLEPLTAQRVMIALSLLFLFGSVWLIRHLLEGKLLHAALLVFASGIGLANCFRFGQIYIILSFLMLLGYRCVERGRHLLGGMALGLFIPIKYYPLFILLPYLFSRQWKVLLGAFIASTAMLVASIIVLGWDVHHQFFTTVLLQHASSQLSLQNPFVYTYQSFDSLLRRLFIFDAQLNPSPWVASPLGFVFAKAISLGSLGTVTIIQLGRLWRKPYDETFPLYVTLCGVLGLLVSPAGATYHFVLLWLPATAMLLGLKKGRSNQVLWVFFAAYACIGFIPYSFFGQFDGHGGLTLLAYPRLALALVLFATGHWALQIAGGVGAKEKLPAP